MCATGSWVCATHECDDQTKSSGASTVKVLKEKEDEFGYMDTKYDLKDTKSKSTDDYNYGDYDDDDYYDDDYFDEDDYGDDDDLSDEDDSLEDYKKEEAKKEFNRLSDSDKKTVEHLENSVLRFQNHGNSLSNSLDSEESESIEESEDKLIKEEDSIVEQYDELLQKSRSIRERLSRLRSSLSAIEKRKEKRRLHIDNLNEVHTDNSERTRSRKQKKYDAYRQSLASTMSHNRRISQVDNDIWEDQWKSKISKHHHDSLSNHL